jgi:hypothetical protein
VSDVLPTALTVVVALASWPIIRGRETSAARIALIAFGIQLGVVLLASVLIGFLPEEPNSRDPDSTCPMTDGAQGTAVAVLAWLAAGLGGVVLSGIVADRRRVGGVAYWHLFVAPTSVVLPYVVITLLLLAWLCGSG